MGVGLGLENNAFAGLAAWNTGTGTRYPGTVPVGVIVDPSLHVEGAGRQTRHRFGEVNDEAALGERDRVNGLVGRAPERDLLQSLLAARPASIGQADPEGAFLVKN